jgi:hypothetical protein
MHRTLFLVVTMCCFAMPTLASAATCDGQQLHDDLQWAIQNNGQFCASHQAFEDLINGACHKNPGQMNQGFANCKPYDGQYAITNWNSCLLALRVNMTLETAFEWRALKPSDCGLPPSAKRKRR